MDDPRLPDDTPPPALPGSRGLATAAAVGVSILALALLVAAASRPHGPWPLAAALAVLGALAACDVVPWRGPADGWRSAPPTYADIADLFLTLGLLLLGPLAAALSTLPTLAVRTWRSRPQPALGAVDVGGYLVATIAGWAAFHGVLRTAGVAADQVGRPGWLTGAAAGAAAFEATVLLACVAGRRAVLGLRTTWTDLHRLHPLWTQSAACAIGVLAGLLWRWHPWASPAAIVPVLALRQGLHLRDLELASRTDAKTGLANYGWFREMAERELRRALRHDTALSLVVVDLDHLREVNSAHGHLAGDVVLKGIADVLDSGVREFDLVCRFGGEEFIVLLPWTGLEEATRIADRLRRAVSGQLFHAATATEPLRATVSLGVAALGDHGATFEELLHAADVAVFRAKERGRNQVCVAGGPPAEPFDAGSVR